MMAFLFLKYKYSPNGKSISNVDGSGIAAPVPSILILTLVKEDIIALV